jgi:polysaccharide deacetylase family protein (PEP-CTERM system associated)
VGLRQDARPAASLTVDVEDWYQSCVDHDAPITEAVLRNMDALLAVLDGVKATFFVQGLVAERFPSLVRELVEAGHEVGSHAHTHRPLHGLDRAALREELTRGRVAVEDAGGVAPRSFRAPDFSIGSGNLWALDEVAEQGFELDSSIFPMRSRHYGIAGWQLGPHRLDLGGGGHLVEAPVAIWRRGRLRLPIAGGGYFRLLPAPVLERGLAAIAAEGRPVIVYCHPYEFSASELDRYRGRVPGSMRLQQRLGRPGFPAKIRRVLGLFPFGRFDEVVGSLDITCSALNLD